MITIAQYFHDKEHSIEHEVNATRLLAKVNKLLQLSSDCGVYADWVDPDTGCQISGSKGGSGDGGYRLSNSLTGMPNSKHKSANAVDVYDPDRRLAQWCLDSRVALADAGLYCEDFRYTPVWLHFQDIPPKSGKRIYIPSASPPLAAALEGQQPIPFVVRV